MTCRMPNTATEFGVPTYTFPLMMVGVMNLVPDPNWSRLPGAWLLLYSSFKSAVYACSTAGFAFCMAHTMPLVDPFAEILGVVPGYP